MAGLVPAIHVFVIVRASTAAAVARAGARIYIVYPEKV
jgi:hypothetical protein